MKFSKLFSLDFCAFLTNAKTFSGALFTKAFLTKVVRFLPQDGQRFEAAAARFKAAAAASLGRGPRENSVHPQVPSGHHTAARRNPGLDPPGRAHYPSRAHRIDRQEAARGFRNGIERH
ncbi:hypothetical protein B0T16DRAFT_396824 [Cercophora newfieldiana]|uniref:Uncharacterized protein n=1 Tax=Cercophora newfieldiana TaxID=92897 RepID=A0AA40CYP6_9PEZI|nr:hypothetical protein B0T16DRAFT_396824 [Cercophora newfieldiana]